MGYSKIVSAAMKMFHLTRLNTYVAGEKDGVIFHDEKFSIPAYMPGAEKGDVLDFLHEVKKINQVYSYVNPWGLSYLGYSFLDQEELYFIVIGPYSEAIPDIHHLSMKYNLNTYQISDLRNTLEKINILTPEQVNSYEAVLQQFDSIKEAESASLVIHSSKNKESKKQEKAEINDEVNLVKWRYWIEHEFMYAVENGDKKAALKLINSDNMLFSFSERFPNNPLRRVKNLAIVLNTVLRIAARNSHVPDISIHHISEKYAFEIEKGENIETIHQVQDHMIGEYCDLVRSNNLKKYSHMIQKVIEYLMGFYDQPIDRMELAELCHTHPGNLSRRFKKETGMTIAAYQQNLQIKQAQHLLKMGNLPVHEIAWMVGYEDPSYFGKMFKKTTGYTPSEYRGMDTS